MRHQQRNLLIFCVLGKMLLSTSPLNYQRIIFEPVGIMWVICNKESKDKRALCYSSEYRRQDTFLDKNVSFLDT